jgi:hypothetical protein
MKHLHTLVTALAAALVYVSISTGAGSPTIHFVSPTAGARTPSTVSFRIALEHFSLDPADVGKRNKAGRGHLHFQMDGGKFDYPKYSGPNGQLAKTLGIAGKYSPSIAPVITYTHLPAGKHKLVVFLANNDHSAQGANATVTFTVR